MKAKLILSTLLAFSLLVPATVSEAKFHSSSRSSFHSSTSHSSSYRSSSPSRSSSSYSSGRKSYSSSPKSSKPSSNKSSYNSGKKSYSSSSKKVNLSKSKPKTNTYSSKSSTVKKTSNSHSNRQYTTRGKVYKSKPIKTKYKNKYVYVSHHYSAGYSPYGWYSYYNGMTTGMFMGSMMHPWGSTYPVNGQYVTYGASPIAWILDFIILMTIIIAVIVIIKVYRNKKA